MDFTVHRPKNDPIYYVAWRKGPRYGAGRANWTKAHIQRPRATKGRTYCGLLVPRKSDVGHFAHDLASDGPNLCRNCAQAFRNETLAIYGTKLGATEVPASWFRIWKAADPRDPVRVDQNGQEGAQPAPGAAIVPSSDTLVGHIRNAALVAQTYVEHGTSELPPVVAWEAFVAIRNRLEAAIGRAGEIEAALDGADVGPDFRLAGQVRRMLC